MARPTKYGKEPCDSVIHVRVPSSKKAAYVKAAQNEGLKLAEWLMKNLDDVVVAVNNK